jgi:O-succinylbenzoate synthase
VSVSPKGIKHRSPGWQIDFAPWQNLKILKGMNDGKYEFLRVRREFRHPFVTGAGSFNEMERVIIKTEENGVVGFGEVAPWPNFKTENISQCLELLNTANGDLENLKNLLRKLENQFPSLESALSSCQRWDEIQKFDDEIECAGLVSSPNEETVYKKIGEGFKTLKFKISPATSLSKIKSIISTAPKNIMFRLDANGSLNLEESKLWVNFAFSSEQIDFIEQPLPVNDEGYRQLDAFKVALDESFVYPNQKQRWAGPVVVKPSLVGDWFEFMAWRHSRYDGVYYSSVFETAIGRQAALWLANRDEHLPAVGFDTLNYFKDDGLDHHKSGPIVRGLANFDWMELWKGLK